MASCSASIVARSSLLTPTASSAGALVLALVVVGELVVEVRPAALSCRARAESPGGNALSAAMNLSRSRRTAAWITLFMLISAMARP